MQTLVEAGGIALFHPALQGRPGHQTETGAPIQLTRRRLGRGIKPGLLFHRIGQQRQVQPEVGTVPRTEILVEPLAQLGLIHEQAVTNRTGQHEINLGNEGFIAYRPSTRSFKH